MKRLALTCCVLSLLLAPARGWSQDEEEELEATDVSAGEPDIAPSTPPPAPKPAKKEPLASERVAGRVGIGYFSGNAPIGIRYWITDLIGIDFNVGFGVREVPDIESNDPADNTTPVFDFALDIGAPIALYSHTNVILFLRPGVNIVRVYADGSDKDGEAQYDDDVTLEFSAIAGAEIFLGALGFPNISFQAGVGLTLGWFFPADVMGDSEAEFTMSTLKTDMGITINAQLGFHIYF